MHIASRVFIVHFPLTLYPPSSWLSLPAAACFSDDASVPDFLVATRLRTLNLFTEADVSMSTAVDVAAADESETAAVSCCNLLPVGRLSLLRIAKNRRRKNRINSSRISGRKVLNRRIKKYRTRMIIKRSIHFSLRSESRKTVKKQSETFSNSIRRDENTYIYGRYEYKILHEFTLEYFTTRIYQ